MGAAAHLRPELNRRLEEFAERTGSSVADHLDAAVERYIEDELAVLESLERSSADLAAGRVVGNDEVIAWLETWGTAHEGPPPRAATRDE